jgi:hypothetical protein
MSMENLKCIKCMTEELKDTNAQYVYHGFSLCEHHFKLWHGMVLKEVKDGDSKIIKPR